jgi:hypothetical protein
VVAYKPGPQALYLVERMAYLWKGIREVLSRPASQLESIETKVDSNQTDLRAMREQVNLVMASLSQVQEEHVHVMKQLKSAASSSSAPAGDGIMRVALASTSIPSVAMSSSPAPPPPPPSDKSTSGHVTSNLCFYIRWDLWVA